MQSLKDKQDVKTPTPPAWTVVKANSPVIYLGTRGDIRVTREPTTRPPAARLRLRRCCRVTRARTVCRR